MSEKFDFDAALKAIQSGQSITGKDGVLAPLVKQLTEAALEGELDSHLAEDVAGADRAPLTIQVRIWGRMSATRSVGPGRIPAKDGRTRPPCWQANPG